MDFIINAYASASGLWKKIALLLPLFAGAGSLLGGLAGFCIEISHAANASALMKIAQGLQADPNTALVLAGLTALGIHTNHTANQAAISNVASAPQPDKPL